ncbi:MAG TPA: metallophosphoesterase [Chryseosolibacter sp.]
MARWYFLGVVVFALFLHACESFEYSPNQVYDKNSKVGLNAKNLELLYSRPQDDTITIAFVGDSQRFYDELDLFIDTVNNIAAVDFVLLAGDISDFGLLTEFELISDMLSKLEKPYIGVVGNHDVVSRGEQVFERMFGPLNFSFHYGGVKFIAHNTNGKEYMTGNVPDLNWLRSQLVESDTSKYFIPVSHVPPFSADFDEDLVGPYTTLFSETPSLLISLHGHIHTHKDGYPYNDGIRYMTTHSFDKKSFVLLKIYNGKVDFSLIDY